MDEWLKRLLAFLHLRNHVMTFPREGMKPDKFYTEVHYGEHETAYHGPFDDVIAATEHGEYWMDSDKRCIEIGEVLSTHHRWFRILIPALVQRQRE